MITLLVISAITTIIAEAIGGFYIIIVKPIKYLFNRKKIKEEKELLKKEKELYEWQRRQTIKEMEEKKKALEEQERQEEKALSRESTIFNNRQRSNNGPNRIQMIWEERQKELAKKKSQ